MENVNNSTLMRLEKRKDHAFGKDIYLLAKDKDGVLYWLEAPTWDCGWYWGFGYVETYTNNKNPSLSREIESHSHWDGAIVGQMEEYNYEKKCFVKSQYVHHINENNRFSDTVLTDSESWKLAELMKTAYKLKEQAEMCRHGGAYITENPCKKLLTNKRLEKKINEVLLPAVFAEIAKILTPEVVQ